MTSSCAAQDIAEAPSGLKVPPLEEILQQTGVSQSCMPAPVKQICRLLPVPVPVHLSSIQAFT